ncbi:MAG: TylF/MycF/NovP-related O-methyltransferase [Polyangiales bacterium]
MKSTQDVLLGWKRHGLSLLNWTYGHLPFLSEFLSIQTKATAVLRAWHLVSRNGTPGDYLEFGVFRGDTFKLAIRAARSSFGGAYQGRFFAFDSFEGLPDVASLAEPENVFNQAEYACSEADFRRAIASTARGTNVQVVKGWFDRTLTPALRDELGLREVAIANIDCDLFESTVPCLEFIAPLVQNGTIVMFDDWYLMRGSMKRGEAQAAEQWLRQNPHIRLVPLQHYGVAGQSFIVNISEQDSPFYCHDVR